MFISHKYKFIYLRSPKTGSSSLSEFFIKNIDDPNAVYTPVDDTKISGNVDASILQKYKKYSKFCHLTLQDLLDEKIITKEIIDEYKCFSVLRNPIDRQKSGYYFRKKYDKGGVPSLQDYKRITNNLTTFSASPLSGMQQTDLLLVGNEIKGNLWLYEDLDNCVNDFMNRIGVEIKHPMPRHKAGIRKRTSDIVFDNDVINALKKHFHRDFEEYNKLIGNEK